MSSVNSCNWIELKIGEIAEVVAGGTPKAGNPDNFKEPGTGIAWLTPADLSGYTRKSISFGARDLSHQGYNSSSAKILPKGSLLFSSRAPIGYVAIAQNEISTNQGFKSFVFPYGVDSDYAYYYLRSLRSFAESLGTGTTFKEISGTTAKKLPFKLPPLAEQKVIADKLDSLLAQVEATKARLQRIPEILKTFRQSVLASAVSGKLTENWRQNKDVNWSQSSLSDICRSVSDGDHQAPPKADSGIPFLVISNISNGEIDFDSVSRWVTESYYESLKDFRKPEINDILYTVTGSFGIPAIVKSTTSFCFQRHIAIIKPDHSKVDYKYLFYYLSSPEVFKHADSVATGTAQKTVSLSHLRNFQISLPTIEEQAEIARQVEDLFAFADKIKQKADSALDRVNNLTQSIFAKAFRGDLTADWRTANPDLISGDNGAQALLKKIKAEREATKGQPNSIGYATKMQTGNRMNKQIIKVAEALKRAGKPLSGQQLLAAAGYPNDSSTEQLEQFFLDIRDALTIEESIVKLERADDSQDWFTLANTPMNRVKIKN
ncbi:TPA: restriction endonuclease subunit S [Aeromonas dhakensis]|uniref:restriction endonuclease subunit S n=1 Tax=Aeromonas veronii TaxID=654 RepID=UPI0028928675|nr:restriction endonuclease subunit S [Aeromonas dhakensis]